MKTHQYLGVGVIIMGIISAIIQVIDIKTPCDDNKKIKNIKNINYVITTIIIILGAVLCSNFGAHNDDTMLKFSFG